MQEKVFIHPELGTFHSRLALRLDWSEMDMFGHINNVMYAKYVQAARVNYWEMVGLNSMFNQSHEGPLLASIQLQFKQPLFYPGNIVVWSKVKFIKNTSFGLTHIVLNEKNEVCAISDDIIVMYDFNKNEKIRVSDWMRKKIEEIENTIEL